MITKHLKTLLNKKNRLHKNYKRHGYKADDKVRLDAFRIECQQAVEMAKLSNLANMGDKLNDPITSQKPYWKIINSEMNKCRGPKVPPLLANKKANYFSNCFSQQYKLIGNSNVLPGLNFLTEKRTDHITTEYLVKCYFYVMILSSYPSK